MSGVLSNAVTNGQDKGFERNPSRPSLVDGKGDQRNGLKLPSLNKGKFRLYRKNDNQKNDMAR